MRTRHHPRPARPRPLTLEGLEDRWVPALSGAFLETPLISDQPGVAPVTDPTLVNGWGIALDPVSFWVSSNGGNVSEVYTGDVNGSAIGQPFKVAIPAGGRPTGQVFNETSDFVVSGGGASGPAAFVFASESGAVTGWNPAVPPPATSTAAEMAFQAADGAVYKGIELANTGTANFLYLADFHNNKVDVLDGTFHKVTLGTGGFGTFADPALPAGFAPFNVAAINGKLYVSYAKQDATATDDVAGAGNGFVSVFDLNGHFLQRLVTQGQLNSPWGMVLAPAGFGTLGGDLVVGNSGDGRLNAYDPATGALLGTLEDANRQPLVVDGLLGLAFGNGTTAGDTTSLYFAAGPGGRAHGLFGKITSAAGGGGGAAGGVVAVSGPPTGSARQFALGANGSLTALGDPHAPFGTFTGAVRAATGDVNGDGTADTVLVTGPGTPIRFAVIDGKTGATLVPPTAPFAGSEDFAGGGFVAAGDIDGDGKAEWVVTPDQGGGPRVTVFSLANGTPTVKANFLGIDDPTFRGGARAALGDVNHDGTPDLAVAAGFLGGPRVALLDGRTLLGGSPARLVNDFFAFPGTDATTLRNGVFVAVGDVDGDGFADLVFGGGPGGAPRVFVLSGQMVSAGNVIAAQNAPVANFFVAGNSADRGGVRVAAKDADGDARADLAVGSGEGDPARVRVYLGKDFTSSTEPTTFQDLAVFGGAALAGGVFVG